ncbi:hypothetical protein [Sulfurovum sp. TSL1]|uniref:hypothetical protein n=1 Tax=Sulfurovum sp. TSL1 TaxID=2826994 RepID=UPI001CC552CE|nr:hypothetical protein [Sulfurovum sp. TSL1]GIT98810.1 hypothetical protein TSL1_16310 [Sulfurovum sp. TSL1]
MKTIFTYKRRRYGYKIVEGHVKTYEIMGVHDDEIEAENECAKLTEEDWEYIFQYCEELDIEV